ncbi:hypothetical protein EJB05_49082 [Eragrostis curvula]|uniref:Uncharacterized protein n=1 Tax=Eragrostis curvula TaxID=38414 RepID=A0A5J9T4K0_9POAL|nr:hypothetical protein EJB05_49082 [Eragrostis curvula]
MAVADRSVSSPPAAQHRRRRRRLALAAADAVMCVCFASAWLYFAAMDAFTIGHAIWGEDSPVLDAAMLVALAAIFSGMICFFSMLALSSCIADPSTKEDKVPASPRSSAAAATREALSKTDIIVFFVIMAFLFFGILGGLVKVFGSVKGSRRERISSVIMDVGFSSWSSLCCLIVIPTLALRTWRLRRSGWRWCDSWEKKPSGAECSVKMGKEPDVPTLC